MQTHRPTSQETWRRDWPKGRSRDRNVTGSKENSLKKLTHYRDRDDTPLDTAYRTTGTDRPFAVIQNIDCLQLMVEDRMSIMCTVKKKHTRCHYTRIIPAFEHL